MTIVVQKTLTDCLTRYIPAKLTEIKLLLKEVLQAYPECRFSTLKQYMNFSMMELLK